MSGLSQPSAEASTHRTAWVARERFGDLQAPCDRFHCRKFHMHQVDKEVLRQEFLHDWSSMLGSVPV
jgi:hypothetical protein